MFWLLLSLAYAIPQTLVDQHLQESINILESEGDYPYDIVSTTGYDNFTAAIMLEQCMTKSSNPFMASL